MLWNRNFLQLHRYQALPSQSRTEAVTAPKQEWAIAMAKGQEAWALKSPQLTCTWIPKFPRLHNSQTFLLQLPQQGIRELLDAIRGLQAKAKKRRKGRIIRATEVKRKEKGHGRCVAVAAHSEILIFFHSEQAGPTWPAPAALSKCH